MRKSVVDPLRHAATNQLTPLRAETHTAETCRERLRVLLGAAVVVGAILAAYHNSFSVPFVFDDPLAIADNPTIRKLWPLTDVLLPPRGEGLSVEGRPVLNLTLALNYAWSGLSVRGYHIVNLAIHVAAALTLFGLVRRTLLLRRGSDESGQNHRLKAEVTPVALVIALLWALHPLQTESVTYVIQRAEALVGLFYLLTLYCFARGADAGSRSPARESRDLQREDAEILPPFPKRATKAWLAGSAVACAIGMATKEVMVSAPLLVLVYDRVFVAGSFRAAWQRRKWVHVALFSSWLLLAALVVRTGTRGGTAGFGIDVTPWQYALTQCEAVTRYLSLSLWPHPLIFDYGVEWVENVGAVLPFAAVLLLPIAGTIFAWRRAPAAAFLGLLFFAVLSPTSSIVPGNRQALAEHRMYLPLAAVVVLVVCGASRAARSRTQRRWLFAAGATTALAFGALTIRRNEDYRSELVLYRDTVEKRPRNGFARYNLGKVYADTGQHAKAVGEYEESLRLMPGVARAHYNLANSLAALGRTPEAAAHYEAALAIDGLYAKAHFNLGNLLVRAGDRADALGHFRAAVSLEPGHGEARANLGSVLLELGRLEEARVEFERVLQANPDAVEARFGLGNVFLLQERWSEAARELKAVVALRPDLAIARERLELASRKAGL